MAEESRDYLVVEFPQEAKEDSLPLAVVPSIWVSMKKKICYWPNFRTDQETKRAVMMKMKFDSAHCKACPINIKYKTNSYEKAVEKMKFLEKNDTASASSQSEEELIKKRKSKPNSFFKEFDCSQERTEKKNSCQSLPKVVLNHSSDSDDTFPALPQPFRDISVPSDEISDDSDNEITVLPEKNATKEPIVSFMELNKMSKETRALVENVNRKVELLADDIKFLIQMVQRSSIVETLENVQPIKMPLDSEEQIIEFNEKLANSEEFFRDACATLLCVGGKDVIDSTRRLMTRVISHDVSLKYNWSGRGGKNSFSDMKNILRLFLVCLRRNPLTKNATEVEIATVIKTWLRTAADRMGGRSRRMKARVDGNENLEKNSD